MRRVVTEGSRPEPDDRSKGESSDLDGSLLVRATTEPEAFGEFYDRNHEAIIRYFMRKTACAHTSAELTAETFAQALAGIVRFDPTRGTGKGWLFGIAGHQFHQWLRRGTVDRKHCWRLGMERPDVSQDDVERIERLADLGEIRPRLVAALDQLSDGMRAAVELRVAQDLPYAEVAARLGCTVGSARVRVARGLKKLSLVLEAS
jgi:RNA polymerase sigma-70 factor (ECF subfamily)